MWNVYFVLIEIITMYLRPTLFSYPKKNKKSRAYTRSIPNNWFTSIVVPVEFLHVCAVVHTRAFLQISHVCRLRSEVYYAVMDSVNAAGGGSASFVFGCAITTPTRYIGGKRPPPVNVPRGRQKFISGNARGKLKTCFAAA